LCAAFPLPAPPNPLECANNGAGNTPSRCHGCRRQLHLCPDCLVDSFRGRLLTLSPANRFITWYCLLGRSWHWTANGAAGPARRAALHDQSEQSRSFERDDRCHAALADDPLPAFCGLRRNLGQLLRRVYGWAGRAGHGYPPATLVVGPALWHHWRVRRVLDRTVLPLHAGSDVCSAGLELPGSVSGLFAPDLSLGPCVGGGTAGGLFRLAVRTVRD